MSFGSIFLHFDRGAFHRAAGRDLGGGIFGQQRRRRNGEGLGVCADVQTEGLEKSGLSL